MELKTATSGTAPQKMMDDDSALHPDSVTLVAPYDVPEKGLKAGELFDMPTYKFREHAQYLKQQGFIPTGSGSPLQQQALGAMQKEEQLATAADYPGTTAVLSAADSMAMGIPAASSEDLRTLQEANPDFAAGGAMIGDVVPVGAGLKAVAGVAKGLSRAAKGLGNVGKGALPKIAKAGKMVETAESIPGLGTVAKYSPAAKAIKYAGKGAEMMQSRSAKSSAVKELAEQLRKANPNLGKADRMALAKKLDASGFMDRVRQLEKAYPDVGSSGSSTGLGAMMSRNNPAMQDMLKRDAAEKAARSIEIAEEQRRIDQITGSPEYRQERWNLADRLKRFLEEQESPRLPSSAPAVPDEIPGMPTVPLRLPK